LDAVQSVTGLPTTTNYKLAGTVLNNMLSNFDPNNATIQKIMSYPQQAYVVTGPMTFVIKLMMPYNSSFFLSDIAQFWAPIVDPSFIDAHGGVQANTPNSYFGLNGGPGTGPYYIASVGTGYSTVLLKANPTYWGLNVSNLSPVMQPARIPVVVINYDLKANEKLEAFATNEAQISAVDFPVLGQMWSAYKYKQYTSFDQVLVDLGGGPNSYWIIMNPGKYPTNNTDFRLAVVHAINYTQLLEPYTFNGTVYAAGYLGPLNPGWGTKYYNPSNLPMYSYDIPLAISYMSEAGQEEHFSLTLPNGTVIGDTSAPELGSLNLAIFTGSIYRTLATIIQSDLSQIGLKVSVQVTTSAEQMTYATPAETPNFMYTMWGPDWPDPVNQQIMYIDEFNPPGSYINASDVNQFNQINYTYVTTLINSLYLETNQTKYVQGIAQLYQVTYNQLMPAFAMRGRVSTMC
jgi:ABC-type oligopeptide transport system substrate-binding subunit